MAVKIYVGAVAIVAALAGVLSGLTVPTAMHPTPLALLLIIALIALSEARQVRYYHHDEVDALNLMEGMLAPLIFTAGGTTVIVVCAVGLIIGDAVRRNPFVKTAFNVSQWVLAASLGSLVLHALRPYTHGQGELLGALLLALLTMSLVNLLALSGVLTVVAGSPIGSRDRSKLGAVAIGHGVGILASLVTGICLAAAYLFTPWTLLIGFVFILAMHLSGHANASLRADGVRLAGLQRATHALATSMRVDDAIPVFLRETRAGFEVRTVQLALFTAQSTEIYTTGEPIGADCDHVSGQHELAELLVPVVKEPARFNVGVGDVYVSAALERTGHQRCLAAPLRSGGRTIGMLLLYDRFGMEGFEHGELSIAAALARELVGFIERVDLLAEIEAERRKLAEILESTSDGILTIDADGVITSWNAGLATITGYPAEEMVETRHFGLLRPRDAAGRDVLIERWREMFDTTAGLPAELQIVSSDGHSIWLSCSYSRIAATEERVETLVVVARTSPRRVSSSGSRTTSSPSCRMSCAHLWCRSRDGRRRSSTVATGFPTTSAAPPCSRSSRRRRNSSRSFSTSSRHRASSPDARTPKASLMSPRSPCASSRTPSPRVPIASSASARRPCPARCAAPRSGSSAPCPTSWRTPSSTHRTTSRSTSPFSPKETTSSSR